MRFSIISDEISQEIAEVRRFVREFGLGGFELRSMFGRAFKDLTPGDVREIRAVITGEGWRIHGCATPVYKCHLDDHTAMSEHYNIFCRSVDVARELGSDMLRVFTFDRLPQPADDKVLQCVADHLKTLAEISHAAGLRLGIENEASCLVGTGEELVRLGRVLGGAPVGWIWDPCNVLYVPGMTDPLRQAPVGFDPDHPLHAEFVRRVMHVHVKNARLRPGAVVPDATPVDEGDVAWLRQFVSLEQSGYSGLYSLETHWRVKALDHALLHLPAGHAFSAGGRKASEICLRRLQPMWAQAADAA